MSLTYLFSEISIIHKLLHSRIRVLSVQQFTANKMQKNEKVDMRTVVPINVD